MKKQELDTDIDTISLSSTCSSVNVDGLWNIVPHCSLRQTGLVICITFTLMQRGILVSLSLFSINQKLGNIPEFFSTSTKSLLRRQQETWQFNC